MHPETHFLLSASSFLKSAVLQTKLQELKDITPNAEVFSSWLSNSKRRTYVIKTIEVQLRTRL